MAVDPRKRQRKIERQRAKQKAQRRELARRESRGMPARMEGAARAPFLHCCVIKDIWEHGIGEVLVSRKLTSGNVAFGAFLVDIFCLGVKDAHADIVSQAEYDDRIYGRLLEHGPVTKLRPECARKLVEGAVRYAADLNLPPHADYRVARLIFGDVSAEECTQDFVYGHKGKPYFFAGPNDHTARCEEVIRTLHKACGPGGYHYTMPISASEADTILEEIEALED